MDEQGRLQQILDIGIALTKEKDPNKLLYLIIHTAMDLTNSDGGTLYMVQDDSLVFRIMRTVSKGIDMGGQGEKIDFPPVPLREENICAYAAINRQALNIEDVYRNDLFDFSGPKRYDEMNGYRTGSMVAIPMVGKDDGVIGVMQLINAMDENKKVRPFTEEETKILMSLASQTAIALTNMSYLEEIKQQMWSFTEALTEAIDARTHYNASHTRKVAQYAGKIVDYMNDLAKQGKGDISFTEEHKEQILLAAYLHDIGKMIVPLEVMNKQTRLAEHKDALMSRLEKIELLYTVDELKGLRGAEETAQKKEQLAEIREMIQAADSAGFLQDELVDKLQQVFELEYTSPEEGETIPYFTQEEKKCLMIRKGTLTGEERKIMESHVVMTERILSKVHFNKAYQMVPVWAAQHHECINGKGYPKGISGEQLGIEARILAVADICDALLATDRPYKKPLPKEKAFAIMEDMAGKGMIDPDIVGYMKACL